MSFMDRLKDKKLGENLKPKGECCDEDIPEEDEMKKEVDKNDGEK